VYEHRWPLLALAPVAFAVAWYPEDSWWFFLVPAVAFVVGLALKPRHVLVLWIGSALMVLVGLGIWLLFNEPDPQPAGQEESWVEVFPISLFLSAFGVLLPAWLGRLLRAWFDQVLRHGGDQPRPAAG
jgi:hypothetical protein